MLTRATEQNAVVMSAAKGKMDMQEKTAPDISYSANPLARPLRPGPKSKVSDALFKRQTVGTGMSVRP